MNKLLTALTLLLFPCLSFSTEAYVHGKNPKHCYYFTSPDGWVADNRSGKPYDWPVVFYPENESWGNTTAIFYTLAVVKTKNAQTPAHLVRNSLKRFRTALQSPNSKAKKIGTVKSKSNVIAPLYLFTGDRLGNTELISYYDSKDTINIFVMSSRNIKHFNKNKPYFIELSQSYRQSNTCVPCEEQNNTSKSTQSCLKK